MVVVAVLVEPLCRAPEAVVGPHRRRVPRPGVEQRPRPALALARRGTAVQVLAIAPSPQATSQRVLEPTLPLPAAGVQWRARLNRALGDRDARTKELCPVVADENTPDTIRRVAAECLARAGTPEALGCPVARAGVSTKPAGAAADPALTVFAGPTGT